VKTEAIFSTVLYLASALFVAIEIALLYSVFRSRRNGGSLSEDGGSRSLPRTWEVVWSVIPATVLLVLILIM
jgi:heme/copper-type cytochrome/quinol oxidase subunit 2